jgi:diguanylate cyclase (GGDEF)-like protein
MAAASATGDLVRRKPKVTVRWNATQWVLTWTLAGLTLHAASGTSLEAPVSYDRSEAPAIALAALTCFASNYVLVGVHLALRAGRSIRDFLRVNFWPAAGEDTAALSLGAAIAFAGIHLTTMPLLLLPFVFCVGGRDTAQQAERALLDPLTELPNRLVFHDRARQAIARCARDGIGGAILLIDLDGFKQVNDTLGHQAGDALLREVAARLGALVRNTDTVARLGGDEFAVLLVGVHDANGATGVTRAIRYALDQPFAIAATTCSIGGSVGVAHFNGDEHDVAALLHQADLAMYDDKRRRARTPPAAV